MIAALSPAEHRKLYELGEALHRAAASSERRWTAFADVRSHVEGLMAALRADCGVGDVEEVAKRLVGTVDYRERFDGAIELAYVEVCAHGRAWSWERC